MAMKVVAGENMKRGDLFYVNPFEIEVREDLRGRIEAPLPEDIIDRAVSLLTHGQLQPVVCRRKPDNRLLLTAGFTRTAAARLIRDGFKDHDGKECKDENFMIQVKVSDANDKEAFLQNVVENAERNETSPIDDAHNQRKMREQHGMNDSEIKDLYRYKDPNKTGRLRKLLMLPDNVQKLIHRGKMTVQAGLDFLDLPADKQKDALEQAMKEDGSVEGSKIRDIVRDHHLSDAVPPGSGPNMTSANGKGPNTASANGTPANGVANGTPARSIPRSMKDVRKFFEGKRESTVDPGQKEYIDKLLNWLSGKITDKQFDNAFEKLTDYERE